MKNSMNKKTFFISTAIDYPSERGHLGHALEKVQADVMARYKRLQGFDVHFSTGLDEHGLKIQRYAQKANKKPQEFVNEMSGYFKDLWKLLNISNDDFIRTTEKRHLKVVQEVLKKIYKKGDIYKGKYKGLYCVDCESYYLPKDLENGNCPVHHKPAELIEEETYFFRMSKYQKQISKHIQENKDFIIPESKRNEILNRLKIPLQDLSISRATVEWGIPFPMNKKFTIAVWPEALMNYLTTIDYPSKKFKKFWPGEIHIGKDIIWHHSVIFPCLLFSAGLELPKTILVHGFITVAGQKMSKSLGNIIDPFELVKKYGTDAVRYFLLREIPPTEDGDFTYEKFKQRYNADLANGIGNTISRVLTMVEEKFNGIIPEYKPIQEIRELKIEDDSIIRTESVDFNPIRDFLLKEETIPAWKPSIEEFHFNICLAVIINGFKEIDKDINEKKPWELPRNNDITNHIFYSYLENLRILAFLLFPFLPETADKIFEQLGLNPKEEKEKDFNETIKWGGLQSGTKIKKGKPLFPRI